MAAHHQDEQRLALFIDFENIAIGVRDAHYRKFDINLVLERLLDKGKLLVKKAYADWSRYSDYKRSFHEAAIELIEVPQKSVGGKNSADIRLVVDAMDMSFQKEHINCFVVASGDSDFSPLVSKLKENNKYVIGLGVKNSTSDLLIENCDEFIFYEDLVRGQQRPLPQIANVPEKVQECFALLVDSVLALQRENKDTLWGSMVKETMKRKKPSFNETYYGFRTFSHLLEDAQRRGIVVLLRDQKSGSYIVEDLGSVSVAVSGTTSRSEAPAPPPAPAPASTNDGSGAVAQAAEAAEGTNGSRRPRRRRGRGRGRAMPGTTGPAEAGASDEAAEFDEAGSEEDGGEGLEDEASPGAALSAGPENESLPTDSASEPAPEANGTKAEPERGSFSLFSWIRGGGSKEG
ncbi:MAG TPA: NYN domain-containing protein [Vicinamibacteria bacterium]|nr:NYN domain-containing protein [Vicinamibacteria bacterium]